MQANMRVLEGRICLITGATSGIGQATAIGLANAGGTVVIVARNHEKGISTVEEIQKLTGNPNIDMLVADLASQQDIHRLANEFQQKYSNLHVLINNAGILNMFRQESVDGIEMTFAINHLAGFLLTHLLLNELKISAPARIVNVSSAAHLRAHLNLDDLQGRTQYSGYRAYGQSKLANLYFTYELARRLKGTGVTANALHPGFVHTNFGRNNRGGKLIGALSTIMGISPEKGALTSIYLAISPELDKVTGNYFVKSKAVPSSPVSYDLTIAQRLWEISEQLTGFSEESAERIPVAI